MLSKEIEKALNGQITIEAESSQVYLAMASYAETLGFEGVAAFMYAIFGSNSSCTYIKHISMHLFSLL